jgi:hypothetical protein
MSDVACTDCRKILKGSATKHSSLECPLRMSQYCGVCACYGHSPRKCPDMIEQNYQIPRFIEQLVPPSLLEEFGIDTLTPLPGVSRRIPKPFQATLTVLDNDKAIREVLRKNNLKPKGRVKANRLLIEQLANRDGLRLIFKKPDTDQNDWNLEKETAAANEAAEKL